MIPFRNRWSFAFEWHPFSCYAIVFYYFSTCDVEILTHPNLVPFLSLVVKAWSILCHTLCQVMYAFPWSNVLTLSMLNVLKQLNQVITKFILFNLVVLLAFSYRLFEVLKWHPFLNILLRILKDHHFEFLVGVFDKCWSHFKQIVIDLVEDCLLS